MRVSGHPCSHRSSQTRQQSDLEQGCLSRTARPATRATQLRPRSPPPPPRKCGPQTDARSSRTAPSLSRSLMVLGSSSSAQALGWSGPGTGAGTMVADAPRPSLLLLHLRLTRLSPTLLRVLADDAHVDSLAPLSGSSPGAQAFAAAFGSAGAGL